MDNITGLGTGLTIDMTVDDDKKYYYGIFNDCRRLVRHMDQGVTPDGKGMTYKGILSRFTKARYVINQAQELYEERAIDVSAITDDTTYKSDPQTEGEKIVKRWFNLRVY